jgi:hypothetical protein
MDALAHDLRAQAPDLAQQFKQSQPSQRRNSGFGLFTEMAADGNRAPPASGLSGDLGTVHAMVAHLPDPIAFKVRMRDGVLIGLLGDSYGQDTRTLDFATAPFDQVFTVDAQGRSIPYEPAGTPSPSLPLDLQDPIDAVRPVEPIRVLPSITPAQKPQDSARPAPTTAAPPSMVDLIFGSRTEGQADPPEQTLADNEKTALRFGLWFALFVVVGILVLIFEVNIVFAFIAAIALGRALQTDKGLAVIKRGIAEWKKAQSPSP